MEKNPAFNTESAALVSWDKPELLFTFLGLIPLIMLGAYHYHKHRPFLHLFASSVPRKEQHLFLKDLRFRYLFSSLFFAVFLSCVVIALAGPRWGRRIVMEYRRGVDVMLAFDVSRSMDVRDSAPTGEKSRLKHATDIALAMIAASQGIRFGAAIGKGQSLLAVPLTYDVETIRGFL